jgi:hypothetical protein
MRTVGDFLTVLAAAREYNQRVDFDSFPIDPVVRRESGEWMLESKLTPVQDYDFECSLDGFCEYWFADGDDITPDESDIAHWVSQFDLDDSIERYTVRVLGQTSFSSVGTIEEAIADSRTLRGMVSNGDIIIFDNRTDEVVHRF